MGLVPHFCKRRNDLHKIKQKSENRKQKEKRKKKNGLAYLGLSGHSSWPRRAWPSRSRAVVVLFALAPQRRAADEHPPGARSLGPLHSVRPSRSSWRLTPCPPAPSGPPGSFSPSLPCSPPPPTREPWTPAPASRAHRHLLVAPTRPQAPPGPPRPPRARPRPPRALQRPRAIVFYLGRPNDSGDDSGCPRPPPSPLSPATPSVSTGASFPSFSPLDCAP